jgi:hypothetical protein
MTRRERIGSPLVRLNSPRLPGEQPGLDLTHHRASNRDLERMLFEVRRATFWLTGRWISSGLRGGSLAGGTGTRSPSKLGAELGVAGRPVAVRLGC